MFDEKITGTVERIIFQNNENSYYVLRVLRSDKNNDKECIVTANHLKICEELSYDFSGQWISNSKYGTQFKASKVVEVPPSNKEAMVKYLSSSFFKGIGPVIARKIVKKFGDQTYDILKNEIEKLLEVPGISKKKFDVIKKSWEINSEINEIMIFLQSYDISTLYATKIYEFFGQDCIAKIRLNPYELTQIENIGFKYADRIALSLGFEKDCKERISAGIKFILSESENNEGHCFLYHHQILQKSIDILGVAIEDKIDEILQLLIDNNEIKLSTLNDEKRYYSNDIYYAERSVANRIDIIKNTPGIAINENIVREWEEELKNEEIQLSDEQKNAILGIVYEKVSVLTGGAGVGKTTVVKSLVKLLEKLKISFELCSPTGRASKRLQEVTGYSASTIHRLLQWDFVNRKFVHDQSNQLSCDFVIIDESSMIGISLLSSLLKAIPQDAQVLMVGDFNQIPPVSCGNPFKDLINSNFIKTFRLTNIFRQSDGSDIISFSYDIINGNVPEIESPLMAPEMWTNGSSCMFIDSDLHDTSKKWNDYPDYSTLYYNIDIVEMIRKLYCETINKYYKEKEIQILIPQNIGEIGTIKINKIIQDSINPASLDKPEIRIGENCFRKFDKIIVVKNSYDYDIFNGDLGKIIEVNPEERSCIIEISGENKIVELKRDGLLLIKHGWAISIHKAQGSEFPIVILPIAMNYYRMLYRQLLYTGISRSKTLAILIGSHRALSIAVNNVDQSKRQTSLIEILDLKTGN